MTQWMTLGWRGHWFWRRLAFDTNVAGLSTPRFQRRGVTLRVASETGPIALIEGWASASTPLGTFKPRLERLRLSGLEADGLSLSFDWTDGRQADGCRLYVRSSAEPAERYAVLEYRPPAHLRMVVRVQCDQPPQRPDLMLLCLCYFWNHFDIGRNWP